MNQQQIKILVNAYASPEGFYFSECTDDLRALCDAGLMAFVPAYTLTAKGEATVKNLSLLNKPIKNLRKSA